MKVTVNYPVSQEGIKLFYERVAIFKSELMLKCIKDLKVSDKVKEEVLKQVIEILNSKGNELI